MFRFVLPCFDLCRSNRLYVLLNVEWKGKPQVINPRRACTVRVVVLGLCVCFYNLPPHTLESQKRIPTDSSLYGNEF